MCTTDMRRDKNKKRHRIRILEISLKLALMIKKSRETVILGWDVIKI